MNEYLFIGGTRDGERIATDGRLHVEFELRDGAKKKASEPVPTELYCQGQINGETETFRIYYLKGLSGNSIMRALVENYRPVPMPAKIGRGISLAGRKPNPA